MILADAITAPQIQYRALLPILIVLGVAAVGVLVEAFVPAAHRRIVQLVLSLGALVAAFVAVVANHDQRCRRRRRTWWPRTSRRCSCRAPSCCSRSWLPAHGRALGRRRGGAFVGQASSVPGSADERRTQAAGAQHTEIYPLAMFALAGMLLFPASNDLLTMFVALEVFSLPLYLLCGLARRRRLLSQEAAMKYFLLGAFASAFFLFGMALHLRLRRHSVDLGVVRTAASGTQSDTLLYAGLALIAVGLLFKIGAVPFHVWTPDVYQGAPTPVTGVHGGLHQGRRLRRAAAGALRRLRPGCSGTSRRSWAGSRS